MIDDGDPVASSTLTRPLRPQRPDRTFASAKCAEVECSVGRPEEPDQVRDSVCGRVDSNERGRQPHISAPGLLAQIVQRDVASSPSVVQRADHAASSLGASRVHPSGPSTMRSISEVLFGPGAE